MIGNKKQKIFLLRMADKMNSCIQLIIILRRTCGILEEKSLKITSKRAYSTLVALEKE